MLAIFAWTGYVSPHVFAGDWSDEWSNGNIVCRANFALDPHRGLMQELSRLQGDLTEELAVARGNEPVELFLFKDKASYQQFVKKRYPSAPDRRALFIKGAGPGQVFVYVSQDLAVDVRHESTHALLHATLPMVPLWLDEGLAEYFEVPSADRVRRKDYLTSLQHLVAMERAPRLVGLETKGSVEEMSAADYRDAWSWVHFMLHGPTAAHEELVSYLTDIHEMTPPGRLSQRLSRRIPSLEEAWVEHFRSLTTQRVVKASASGSRQK
jgi:hypothetical protein